MLINQELVNNLEPIGIIYLRISIDKLYKRKATHAITNYENGSSYVTKCPYCGSINFVRKGFNPHYRQKCRCKDCQSVFMATTGTLFKKQLKYMIELKNRRSATSIYGTDKTALFSEYLRHMEKEDTSPTCQHEISFWLKNDYLHYFPSLS